MQPDIVLDLHFSDQYAPYPVNSGADPDKKMDALLASLLTTDGQITSCINRTIGLATWGV